MWGALGLASAACAGIGYLIQSSAETNRKIADFLERDVRRTSIRDIVKSVEDSATNAYKSSNVYEFAGRTWAPQAEYVRGAVTGEPVVMSRVVEHEILSIPQEKKDKNGTTIVEYLENERLKSILEKGETLYIVDESSFEGTNVTANNVSADAIREISKESYGLEIPEKRAGVAWVEVPRKLVPDDLFIYNGTKRETVANPQPAVNVNVTLFGGDSNGRRLEVLSKGYVTTEKVVPRLKPVVAVGRVDYDPVAKRVTFSPGPITLRDGTDVSIGLFYGDSASLRAHYKAGSSETAAYFWYLMSLGLAGGAVATLVGCSSDRCNK